ncbi:MAG: hypothetical protein RL189_2872 [Pseudomonadota bacterium]|jgi:adenylate cyclase
MFLTDWLLKSETRAMNPVDFLNGLAAQARSEGLPVDYISFSLRHMHPEIAADNLNWSGEKGAEIIFRKHVLVKSAGFMKSPVALVYHEGRGLRRRLNAPSDEDDYPILNELFRSGHTDYLIEPLQLTPDLRSYISWSTKNMTGFSETDISKLTSLTPLLSCVVAFMSHHRALEALLEAYLGRQAGQHVLSGNYKRGDGSSVDAVIWFSDMRNFTTFTDKHSLEQTLQRLNRCFDVVGSAIHAQDGEILKFIGDAVLAIFPITDSRDQFAAAKSAVAAADFALNRLNEEALPNEEPIKVGIGIHKGIVSFGNVGTKNRLDYTVIGTPVNECSRVESLCKQLGEDVLLTDAVAKLLPEAKVRSLGEHQLRGLSSSRELFALADKS